ncbi:MAG: nucleotidyltransferase domain-containing protein [Chloroflexia bacterium]|nr:nucleotidyltransferase domain-containing protein [Chloroflexia bacterium]
MFSRLIRSYINEIDSKSEIILYGSRARGDEKKDSDWDILILTNYPTDLKIESKFRDKLYELELETGGNIFSICLFEK